MNISVDSSISSTTDGHTEYRLDYDIQFAEAMILGFLTTFISFMTATCNLILISVIIRTPSLHTKTNMMLLSVAGSELVTGMFVMPFVAALSFNKIIRLPSTLCSFVSFITSLTNSSKSFGMLSLSVDRCIAVSHPLQYTSFITRSTTAVFVVCVWSVSLLFAVIPYLGVGKYIFMTVYSRCMLDIDNYPVFTIVKEVTCTILPAAAILVTLIIIIVEERSHHRVITIAQLAIVVYSGPAAVPGINYSRSTFKAMRTYFIITCIYLCTCLPKSLYIVSVAGYCSKHSNVTFTCFTILSFFCCMSTPLVITTLNNKFKQSIKTMFERKNKVRPLGEVEPYTISTGLHSILESSFFPYQPNKEIGKFKRESRDDKLPGPSGNVSGHMGGHLSVRFAPRKVSILHEVQSCSSNDLPTACSNSGHAPLQKRHSSPS